jgi:prephenate dehydrogenase
MQTKLIGIIGLQQWGASAGLALRRAAPQLTIAGHDRDRQRMKQAKASGAVSQTYVSVANLASDADILILAEPLSELEETVGIIGRYVPAHCVVLDFAPFKRPLLGWMAAHLVQGYYIPCQPIPPALPSGEPTADFFAEGAFCLLPSASAHGGAIETAANLGRLLGCTPLYLDLAEYESYMHALHTLPSLLATALHHTVANSASWGDMARMAGGPFSAVTALMPPPAELAHWLAGDKTAVRHWLTHFTAHLETLLAHPEEAKKG